jgi:hypothetical protein
MHSSSSFLPDRVISFHHNINEPHHSSLRLVQHSVTIYRKIIKGRLQRSRPRKVPLVLWVGRNHRKANLENKRKGFMSSCVVQLSND